LTRRLAALALGLAALCWIVLHAGAVTIGQDVRDAVWAVLPMTAIHGTQLGLSALAWRLALGSPNLSALLMLRIRWIREGVNALLPVAQIGGQVAAVRLLGQAGLPTALAAAGTLLDLTLEAAAQFVFTLLGLAIVAALDPAGASRGWILGGALVIGLAALSLFAAQRLGLLRLAEAVVAKLSKAWRPLSGWSLSGWHDRLMQLQRDRTAMLRALCWHTLSWTLGGAEVWVALRALDQPVSGLQAVAIESLGMVARSAGFVVPGALGVQEGGFVLACGLFGIPADLALAMSALKRLREVLVGLPALIVVLPHLAVRHHGRRRPTIHAFPALVSRSKAWILGLRRGWRG
jgi:putative membrane protein